MHELTKKIIAPSDSAPSDSSFRISPSYTDKIITDWLKEKAKELHQECFPAIEDYYKILGIKEIK